MLPTRSQESDALANVLSISTAGKNRYLFHFSTVNALTQWTAGIRLAMYEHATLQEAYTGSLIAGKGKNLNNIKIIMDKTRLKTEGWTRVRFGAGTPWRRCWCLISPPDEKESRTQQKLMKKKSAYDRTTPVLKGDIKFYDTRKTKKAQPIATIKDAYSAYAIYPQSKPLIDQSTLVKIEGVITVHSSQEATTEGFIFVMPEARPAISGFELLLRFLFPVYDIFGLYGRPNRLIADTLDTRSLMFALPKEKRYGYLEIFDVATLIHSEGSQGWNEQEWRKQLKSLTSQRITRIKSSGSRPVSGIGTHRAHRNSLPPRTGALRFDDGASTHSTPSIHRDVGESRPQPPIHTGSAPPSNPHFQPVRKNLGHERSMSEVTSYSTPRHQRVYQENMNYTPSRLSYEAPQSQLSNGSLTKTYMDSTPPQPPAHGVPIPPPYFGQPPKYAGGLDSVNDRSSSESERPPGLPTATEIQAQTIQQGLLPSLPPDPVATPPAFAHQPGDKPQTRPYHSPELRRANSRMSSTTLSQLAAAGHVSVSISTAGEPMMTGATMSGAAAATAWRGNSPHREGTIPGNHIQRGVNYHDNIDRNGMAANHAFPSEAMIAADDFNSKRTSQGQSTNNHSSCMQTTVLASQDCKIPASPPHGLLVPSNPSPRSGSPLSHSSTQSSPSNHEQGSVRNFSRKQSQSSFAQDDVPPNRQPTAAAPVTPVPLHSQRPKQLHRPTSQSIARKPLPSPTNPSKIENQPRSGEVLSSESSARSTIEGPKIDQMNAISSQLSLRGQSKPQSIGSSHYDTDSPASPDGDIPFNPSHEPRRVPERTRSGTLKTVGGTVDYADQEVVVGDTRYIPHADRETRMDIPEVDFGPTQSFNPASVKASQVRPRSADRLTNAPESGSAWNTRRNRDRSPAPNLVTPEPKARTGSASSESENRRSIAWQPGAFAAGGNPSSKQSITPEQFVQQRAAANRITPVYAHGRKPSGTPPVSRHSGDWSGQSIRKESPSRPHSRGPPAVFNAPADYSAHLSAREQEHVARVTGSPFINMAAHSSRPTPQGSGLVGAIEAREREKKEIKDGMSGQMVQHAIAQRQQHAQAQYYAQQQQQQRQYGHPSPQLNIPGQFPQSPAVSYGQLNGNQPQYPIYQASHNPQRQWMNPGAQIYWGAAQNASPSPEYMQNLYQQQQGQYQGQYPQNPSSQPQHESYFGNYQGGRQ